MSTKPRNAFDEEQKRRKLEQQKYYRLLREKQVRKRLGLTRKKQQIVIGGLEMFFVASPMIVRERYFRCEHGRKYHIAIWRYYLCSADGRQFTALQAQAHDASHGWMLNVTGFWGLKESSNG